MDSITTENNIIESNLDLIDNVQKGVGTYVN